MANETRIGQLVIDLQIKTQALEKGLESAKKKLQEIEHQNEQVKNSNKNLDASFIAMSAGIITSLTKIKSAIDTGIDKYKEYESANKGLESIVNGQGLSFNKAQSFIEDYISDGLIPLQDATLAYKNLAARGYNEEQIKQTMIALKDAAAFGRQATYEYGEAIATATEGLKNENSILVDNAGVTKNVAKMWEDYAKSIGKTTDSLTQVEKIQAEVNGIQEESKNQIGDSAKYAETYAGQQAQVNAINIELSKTIGESMIPTLTQYSSLQLSITKGLTDFISNHKGASSGIVAFTTTLLAMIAGLAAAKKAYALYKAEAAAADMTTKAFTASLLANPITLVAVAIASVVAGYSIYCTKAQETAEAQEKLNEATERYNKIKDGTYEYTQNSSEQLELENKAINKQLELLTKKIELEEQSRQLSAIVNTSIFDKSFDMQKVAEADKELGKVQKQLIELNKEYDENIKNNTKFGNSIEELNEILKTNEKGIAEANASQKIKKAIEIDTLRTQQQEAAQLKINANTMQNYLNIVKAGNKSTTEYQDAVKALANTYPEAANAEGILIDLAQDYINKEQSKADQSWNTSQEIVSGNIEVINTYIKMAEAAEDNIQRQKELANEIGISYENIIPTLTSVLNILQNMSGYSPTDVPNIKPTSVTKKKTTSSSSKSYSNKALDNYKKEIEYKKSLDQISLRDEINMYETALKKYAKTQDEKRELTTKLYELRKELTEKTLDDYTAQIDYESQMGYISTQQELARYEQAYNMYAKTFEQKRDLEVKIRDLRVQVQEEIIQKMKEEADKERELLNQKTEDYKKYIEDQKNLRGAEYDVKEQEEDFNKIIEMHRNYLNQITKDERYSLEERESIYREELDIIRDYEQQKRDLRVNSINNTVSQLKSAITKQIEEMENADEEAINKNIEAVEKWKNARIDAINEEYNARIKAIQDELDALDKAEQQKTRDEEDSDYNKKRKRLEELIAYEHDETTKANYIKELEKLKADYQKTVDKRILSDKKETLKEQQELLKEEQTSKVDAIQQEAEKQKEQYEIQLDGLKEYYSKQKEMAQETAEKMLLNVEQNQEQILNLLNQYGDKYEITGQSLGEKLAQGINNTLSEKITAIIQTVQDRIDGAIENQISKWTNAAYKYEQATSQVQKQEGNKTIEIHQHNTITSPVDSPSTAYKKQETLNRDLASQISGLF